MALDFIDLIKGVEAMAKDSRERASEELLSIATDIEHKTDCLRQSLALIRSFYYE
jgi:hypothetical protein